MLPDLSVWSITLAGIGIAVFTFTVTFLSDAIEESRRKQNDAEKKKAADFELKVNDLQNKINEFKGSGNSEGVETILKEINKEKKKQEKEIKRIRDKYNSLQFNQSILIPGSAFIVSYICSEVYKSNQLTFVIGIVFWIVSLLLLVYGTYRVLLCLSVVQEISLVSENPKTRMKMAFLEALKAHDLENQESVNMIFNKQTFPLKISPGTELKFNYRVSVLSGKSVHNCEAWFFIPDGFDLILPTEHFRQADDFVVPNIRTIRIQHNTVTKGTATPGLLICNAPKINGKYYILYRVKSEEVSSERQSLEIIVEN
ncbi:MAG: hypothetical protein Q8L88_09780 [Bacteroidota bacterium]|nr:hypothetical protein [Bacteroidota bacterium]